MQQKSKSIIFIFLICFISLLFFPAEAWGVNPIDTGGGGGSCIKVCAEMEYETVDLGYGPFDKYTCVRWHPLPPECFPSDGTTDDGKEKGWRCRPEGPDGVCEEYKSTSPKYSTLAQCQEHCPFGFYLECRPSLLTHRGLYCERALWEINKKKDECITKHDPCYICDKTARECILGKPTPYASLSACESKCVVCSVTATATPNPILVILLLINV